MSIEQSGAEEDLFAFGLKHGDKFTMDGCGYSARGHVVLWGRSVKTRRKMKVARLAKYIVEGNGTAPILPAIIDK